VIIELLACAPYVNTEATLYTTSFTAETTSPANASCSFAVSSDGNIYANDTTGDLVRWAWKSGDGIAADYQVYCTDNSGNIAGGLYDATSYNAPVGQWLSCSTERRWGVYRQTDTAGTTTGIITLQIRSALDGRVLATGTITMNAKVV
jgi:hypothetical protein